MGVLIWQRGRARLGAVLTASLFVAACSGAATTPAAPTTAATAQPTTAATAAATAPAATTAGATAVDVTLQEWSVAPSLTTIPAGSVTFTAKNVGTEPHEMVVLKTDLGLLELPTGSDGKVPEEGPNLKAMGEVSELAAGVTGSVTLDLAPGHYLLICNIVDADGTAHYGKGMTSAIIVN
jgi:uncharacterized cupredoxin-like copper-binding protein